MVVPLYLSSQPFICRAHIAFVACVCVVFLGKVGVWATMPIPDDPASVYRVWVCGVPAH
eukprot:m.40822 g.40822  ORF g.40822 m.40822 type:complete len:59 (+) comp6031_c0_seq1:542-718(+)